LLKKKKPRGPPPPQRKDHPPGLDPIGRAVATPLQRELRGRSSQRGEIALSRPVGDRLQRGDQLQAEAAP